MKDKSKPRRRERPPPIAFGDIDRIFDDPAITDLAQIARLPPNANIKRFGHRIRISVRNYLEIRKLLNEPQLRAEIQRLYRLNRRIDQDWGEGESEQVARQLATAIDAMPADLRRWLTMYTPPAPDIPAAANFLSPDTRQDAVRKLRRLLSSGGAIVIGRKRPGGKRSRAFKPRLNVPIIVESKRPRDEAARKFIEGLALAWVEVGKKVPARVNEASPFANFVSHCFELAGVQSGNVVRLINERGKFK